VKDKCAVVNHSLGKIAHDWFGLGSEVTEHYIRLPAADELDDVGVHLGNEKGHGPAGAKRSGRYVCWGQPQGGS